MWILYTSGWPLPPQFGNKPTYDATSPPPLDKIGNNLKLGIFLNQLTPEEMIQKYPDYKAQMYILPQTAIEGGDYSSPELCIVFIQNAQKKGGKFKFMRCFSLKMSKYGG